MPLKHALNRFDISVPYRERFCPKYSTIMWPPVPVLVEHRLNVVLDYSSVPKPHLELTAYVYHEMVDCGLHHSRSHCRTQLHYHAMDVHILHSLLQNFKPHRL